MLSPAEQGPSGSSDLLDAPAIAAELEKLAALHAGRDREMRNAVAQHLKAALVRGRAKAEQLLLADRHGRRCAERLCHMQDEIIRILFELAEKHLYPAQNPSKAERMAIVATGGYGRGILAPGSDIDLLFLLPYKQTAWCESIAEAILYCLWDMGLKVGHATRSIDECTRQSMADMTIRTGILEARFLLGDRKLYDDLMVRFDKEVVAGTAKEFVAAKLAEREERHRRAGQSRYLVEPNVKDGKGGLRDLHTLYWIAKYVYRVKEREELIEHGVYDRREYTRFRRCGDFLWAVRCHMHFVTGRAEERLSFDIQREIAVRLGYTEHPGQRDVERFMKHYFLVAKDVGDLTAILCAELEDSQAKAMPALGRVMAKFRPRRRRHLSESDDFIVDYNRINVADPEVFARDPVNLIRIFALAQKYNLAFHPDALRLATRSLKLIDQPLRENEEANRIFLEILTSKNAPETVLRRMNETGVLGHFVQAFGRIVAMMQFNMYHHYTVDEHLLRCIGILSEIDAGTGHDTAFASELMRSIQPQHRTLLYIAVFLHDIAKGRVEDHSIAGARIARRFCPRLGCSPAETETVAWLVEQHLVMSSVAQSRDLSDRMTIQNFAGVAQSIERMKLLTILTTADIKGVGPGVWNGWKAQLLRTLYYETEPVLTGGFSEVNRAQRVAVAQAELKAALADWPAEAARRLCGAALSGLLAQGRSAAEGGACPLPAGHRGGGEIAVDHDRLRCRARRGRAHGVRARPSLAVVDHRRRLRHGGRQYRGRADLHHHRRAGAGHHRGVARVRARRGRGAARRPRRRDDRAGAARRHQAARDGGQAPHPQGTLQGLRARARGDDQQCLVGPLHHGRGDGARPSRAPVRADLDAVAAQPEHRLRPCGDLRGARGRRVLHHRPVRGEDHLGHPPGGDQARLDPALPAARSGRRKGRGRRRG